MASLFPALFLGGSQEDQGRQEESGGAKRSQEEPGGARRSQEEPEGARRSQEEPGGARRSQEEPSWLLLATPGSSLGSPNSSLGPSRGMDMPAYKNSWAQGRTARAFKEPSKD